MDFGCGGGIDVILAAHKVGPAGRVVGVDAAPQMIEKARGNLVEAGLVDPGVELRVADLADTGLPAGCADVVISNCVINLSIDKPAVLLETARVLKPGGRIGISDVVAEDRLSPADRSERGSYSGCIAGALSKCEYEQGLAAAGFEQISIEFTHQVEDGMHGAIVKAVKAESARPVAKPLPLAGGRSQGGCC